jgi:hypothetical protein
MPRPRQRVCLEAGLKFELYRLMRRGCVVPGCYTAFHMSWRNTYTNEQTAIAVVEAEMRQKHEGYLRIKMHDLEQAIILTPRARGFGGHQWYFNVSRRGSLLFGFVETARSERVPLPARMGKTCSLCLAISRSG